MYRKNYTATFLHQEPEPDPEPETQLYAEPAENGPVPQHCMLFRLYMYVGLKVELFLMC